MTKQITTGEDQVQIGDWVELPRLSFQNSLQQKGARSEEQRPNPYEYYLRGIIEPQDQCWGGPMFSRHIGRQGFPEAASALRSYGVKNKFSYPLMPLWRWTPHSLMQLYKPSRSKEMTVPAA